MGLLGDSLIPTQGSLGVGCLGVRQPRGESIGLNGEDKDVMVRVNEGLLGVGCHVDGMGWD